MKTILMYLVLLIAMLAGSLYGLHGDEIDNLLGGRIIAQGGVLYRDYWSHHMPLMYELAAGMYRAGARSNADFRLLWACLLWLGGVVLHRYDRRSGLSLLALALFAPVLQLNLVMAESMVGVLAFAAWWLLSRKRPGTPFVLVLLAWAITAASLKHVYLSAWIIALTVWIYRKHRTRLVLSIMWPAVLTMLYLLASQNGVLMLEQAYQFNAHYYAPYAVYPGEPVPVSPVDALVVTVWHYVRAQMTLPGSLHIPFAALSLVTLVWLIALLRRRRWFEALVLAGVLVLSYPTNEPRYATGSHFITHYVVLLGIGVYAVSQADWISALPDSRVSFTGWTRRHPAAVRGHD